jgi:hypothetical protein
MFIKAKNYGLACVIELFLTNKNRKKKVLYAAFEC